MVVERRDGFLRTLAKTKTPFRVARGERTWSPLKRSKPVILVYDAFWGTGEEKTVGAINEDQVIYLETGSIFGYITSYNSVRILTEEEINNPDTLWAGKIRWR